jgi:hypothetical protein
LLIEHPMKYPGSLTMLVAITFTSGAARADCSLSDLIGYTLLARKTIAGYIDNQKKGDDFEGCEFGRIIVFDDNTGVRCATYSYSYSYRPDAYIFARGVGPEMKMCVEEELYDIAQLR